MRSRRLGAAAAVWTSVTICLPLLYRGEHWASDIVAGAVVGVTLMILLCRLVGATGLPDRILRFSATHPPAFYAVAWLFALEIAQMFEGVQAYLRSVARLARSLVS
jgi:undecaprenyl-diphosphatase